MDYQLVKRGKLWIAVFTNGHETKGDENANIARGYANAYIRSQLLKGIK